MITKNTFEGGINHDINDFSKQSNTYESANNVKLTEEENFLSLQNLRGTSNITTIQDINPQTEIILGVFENEYKVNGFLNIPAITIFSYNTLNLEFTIKVVVLEDVGTTINANTIYTVYSEILSSDESIKFLNSNPVIDGIKYSENSIDTIYFTDGYHELRKLRCEIDTTITTTVTRETLSLLRRACFGKINGAFPVDGGSLLTGSYQFALRLVNNQTNTYTKYTIFSNPVNIYNFGSSSERSTGDFGEITDRSIAVNVSLTQSDLDQYTHYQLAVINNTGTIESNVVSELKTTPLLSATFDYTFLYKSNEKINSVDIAEFVVDKAAINRIKTLNIKNNRLFAGNIEYHQLDYNNNDPIVTSGTTTFRFGGTSASDSTNVGYWRDETYRFGISYFDEFYNFSRPKILDMSGVTNNRISTGVTDMKFPKIGENGFELISIGDTPNILGLELEIDNHPTWAKGFVILRAKRIKTIVAQTPVIPMSKFDGMPVKDNYPSTAVEPTGTVAYDLAQPMNPLGAVIPKNYFYSDKRDAILNTDSNVEWKTEDLFRTASTYDFDESTSSYYKGVFVPEDIYESSQFSSNTFDINQGNRLEIVDVAMLKAFIKNDTITTLTGNGVTTTIDEGDYIETKVHGTFFADNKEDYYSYSSNTSDKNLSDINGFTTINKINKYTRFENAGVGISLGGQQINKYDNLETSSISWGTTPSVNRMGVIQLNSPRPDPTSFINPVLSDNTNLNFVVEGGTINPLFFDLDGNLNNAYKFLNAGTNVYVNAVEIGNIKNSKTDSKYGDNDNALELISTGSYHVFNNTELSNVVLGNSEPVTIEVFGGDCRLAMCNYKITDGHYAIMNQPKNNTGGTNESDADLLNKWGRLFNDDTNNPISMPVALNTVSQVVSVFIESDYQLEVLGSPTFNSTTGQITTASSFNLALPNNLSEGKSFFNYFYNFNLNKENSDKVFTPYNEFESTTNVFPARIAYSNQKVYQSDLEGFDTFSVLDFYDLDETYRGITGLRKASDRMMAIQEDAIAYVPIDSDTLETADGLSLSVRTGEIISTPIYISNAYGSNLTSLSEEGSEKVYFFDLKRKSLFSISGDLQLQSLSDIGFIDKLNSDLRFAEAKNTNFGLFYNSTERELMFYHNVRPIDFSYVFNERLNLWECNLDLNKLSGVITVNGITYMIGQNIDSTIELVTFNTSNVYNQFFGFDVLPNVRFIVNDDINISKTFDNMAIFSSNLMGELSLRVKSPSGDLNATGIDVGEEYRDGAIRVKILRNDADNQRLRGTYAIVDLTWDSEITNSAVSLNSVITKYRQSARAL